MKKKLLFIWMVSFCQLGLAESAAIKNNSHVESSSMLSPISQMKALRDENKLTEAIKVGSDDLLKNPKNVDVMLELGFISLQEKKYQSAEKYFSEVLKQYPNYTDARIGLINAKLALAENERKEVQVLTHLASHLKKPAKIVEQSDKTGSVVVVEPKNTPEPIIIKLNQLRKDGHYQEAEKTANDYLAVKPEDVDARFILGLIYLHENENQKAEKCFQAVLNKFPSYDDARIYLAKVKIKIANTYEQDAINLVNEGLKISSTNKSLRRLKEKLSGKDKIVIASKETKASSKKVENEQINEIFIFKKDGAKIPLPLEKIKNISETKTKQYRYDYLNQVYGLILDRDPGNVKIRILLADVNLEHGNDRTAFNIIQKGLEITPNNMELLLKKTEIEILLHQYALAQSTLQSVLQLDQSQKVAKGFISDINEISPRYVYGLNQLGFYTDNAWVQDLQEIWDYSTLYYTRDTAAGLVTARVNYASRTGTKAPQYEIDFSPRLNRNIYFDLAAAYSNQAALFPNYMVGAEGYWNIPDFLELSGGTKRSQIESTYFSTRTISLTRYQGQYMFTFRPFKFVPKDNNDSVLYTATARRYFSTNDHYLSATVGTGHSPDLVDLITVNFLIITNNFVTLNYEFPVLNHRLVFDVGAGYQRWGYPSGLVRNLYDGSIGVKCRF